jgi:Multicopper oxidase
MTSDVNTQAREDTRTMHATLAPIPRTRAAAVVVALALLVAGLALPGRTARAALVVPTTARVASAAAVSTVVALPSAVLPPSTACSGAGPVTCELWAKPGSLTLAGGSVPVWGFADTAGGAAGTPGPVLTATSGQSVTLTVHNGLPHALALAVPGVASTGAAGDDTTGAAPGGTASYSFTAPAPGTYLYEAGHTAMGARQVAMGLVGALVVRPADFADNQTLDGTSTTAFDDEVVLVLTEVDPAFNAAPASFNLKAFHPTHRLINGQEFPNTTGIATDHTRRTLLRYVNGGVLGHSMGVLGVKQQVLATNAKPSSDRPALVADMIAAGQTEDALVTFPAGGADRLPVYETAGTLDNAGQAVGTTRIVGFGGMLTFLTAGTVATGDNVGPTVSNVAVSPNPATPAGTATVTATASDATTGNSAIKAAEFVIDSQNVALGTGTAMDPVDGAWDEVNEPVTGTISTAVLSTLTQGTHTMYVRAQDSALKWGAVSSASFRVGNTGPTTTGLSLTPNPVNSGSVLLSATGDDSAIGGQVDVGEYFVDPATVPVGNGTGTAVTVAAPATVASGTATITSAVISGLLPGSHTVYVHFHDSSGLWGPTATITLKIDRTGPAVGLGPNQVTPSLTDGTQGSQTDPTSLKAHATFVDALSNVVAAEGFLDNAAGTNGTGFTFLADDGSWSSPSEAGYGLVPLSQLIGLADGIHHVYAHGKDAAGNWGPFADLTFTLDRGPKATSSTPAPFGLLAGPQALATATALTGTTITAAEMFRGSDPGVGNGSSLVVSPAGGATASLVVEPRSLGVLSNQLVWVRAKDSNGIWGKAVGVTVTVTGLFGDGFESGSTSAWSSVNGATRQAVLKAAAIDGSWGLRVTAQGTNTSYVQRNVSNSSTTLHAAAKIDAQSFSSGTSATALVTVLQVATTTAQVAAVQLRNGPVGRQVRLVVGNGGGATTGPWTALTAGVHEIRLDRTVTGTTRPTSLRIDGALVGSALTNGTAAATVFRVGVVTATGSTNAGLLYVDSFGATT